MFRLIIYPILVGFFAIATAAVGIRGTSVGQHIGAAFFIGGSSGIAAGFIFSYFHEANIEGATFLSFILSVLATWLISYLLVNVIYVADQQQASKMATIVSVGLSILALIYFFSIPRL